MQANLEVIICDTLSIVSRLNYCSFQFVPRDCNRVVHDITKFALSSDSVT